MFWNSKPDCPVSPFDKDWIEKSFIWFENHLRNDFLKEHSFLLPTKEVFPFDKIQSGIEIEKIIEIICNHIEFDSSKIDIKIIVDDEVEFSEGIKSKNSVYDDFRKSLLNENGKYDLLVYSMYNDKMIRAIHYINRQLVYFKMRDENIFNFFNGHMNDMASLLYGLGIINGNSVILHDKWKGMSHYGWSVSRAGFMTQQMYGYTFALVSNIRNETNPSWVEFLSNDIKGYYKRALRYLQFESSKNIVLNKNLRTQLNDEDVFIRKSYYKDGPINVISHLKDGKYEGLMTFYHKNGQLWSERIYKNGIPFTVLSNYDIDGNPIEKGDLKEGNGKLYIYNPDGTLNKIEEYKDCKLIY